MQNKCNVLEVKVLDLEKERDKVVTEYKLLQEIHEVMNRKRQAEQLEILDLKKKLSKDNQELLLENKSLHLKQKKALKLYIKNTFFKAFKYVFPESLKHPKYGLGRCYNEIFINDEVEQKQYKKSVIKLLNSETSQRRHECVKKVKNSIRSK